LREVPPLMSSLNVIGSAVESHECPRCGAHDRERHLLLYMSAVGISSRLHSLDILHFAPERHLSRYIRARNPRSYIPCDLNPREHSIQRANIECIPYASDSFDLVLANHVLEHIDDDLLALSEIRRVLRFGGQAILQTPFSPTLFETWWDAGIVTRAARRHAFGQEDHVRLYGRDLFRRITSSGLISKVRTHEQLLPSICPLEFGVNPLEPFFLFSKE
jgi:SAM-dependent methyltransferase